MKNGCTMKMLQYQKLNLTLNISLDMSLSIERQKKTISPLDTGKDDFTSDPKEMCNLMQNQYKKSILQPQSELSH